MSSKEIDPQQTTRAKAFEYWMSAPNPMVTFFKTFDIIPLIQINRKYGLKLNMLLDYCIGKAAFSIKEFYLLPVTDRLIQYDKLAINTIVMNKNEEVSSCDIPFTKDLKRFNADYLRYTKEVSNTCMDHDLSKDHMVIGTSAIVNVEIDGAFGMNSGIFNNPFLIWGKYRRKFFKTTLTVSFQFHHTQMDGAHAARFLTELQNTIHRIC